jgi:OOP family OmpA-OmpF porin
MKQLIRVLFGATCLALLGGMSLVIILATNTYAAGANVSNPSTFNEYLAQAYSQVADMEKGDAADQIDTQVMGDRAIRALHGYEVLPLFPDEVRLVHVSRESLQAGRDRMIRVLNNQQKVEQNPQAVAQAQVAYDCWAIHQQAAWNASHNRYKCEENFQALINQLDTEKQVAMVVQKPLAQRYDVITMENVYFGWDKSALTPQAKATLDKIKTMLEDPTDKTKRIALQGFADSSGTVKYNQSLSERRVQAVVDYLDTTPVDAGRTDTEAYGETNLPVPTANGVREANNRVTKVAIVREKMQAYNDSWLGN